MKYTQKPKETTTHNSRSQVEKSRSQEVMMSPLKTCLSMTLPLMTSPLMTPPKMLDRSITATEIFDNILLESPHITKPPCLPLFAFTDPIPEPGDAFTDHVLQANQQTKRRLTFTDPVPGAFTDLLLQAKIVSRFTNRDKFTAPVHEGFTTLEAFTDPVPEDYLQDKIVTMQNTMFTKLEAFTDPEPDPESESTTEAKPEPEPVAFTNEPENECKRKREAIIGLNENERKRKREAIIDLTEPEDESHRAQQQYCNGSRYTDPRIFNY